MIVPISYPFQITHFCSAHDFLWNSDYIFTGERHRMWELVCVLDGQVEIAEDDRVYLLRSGDFICHAEMEFHRIRSYDNTCPRVLVSSFLYTGTLPERLKEGVFHLTPSELHAYQSVFSAMAEAFQNGGRSAFRAADAAFQLSCFLYRLSQKSTRPDSRNRTDDALKYQQMIRTMQSSVLENLSLQQLAERSAVSISSGKALFHQYAGIGPKTYYNRLRGIEACRLLAAGKSNLEIAELMNFSSSNYFSRFFNQQFHISPGAYRRQYNAKTGIQIPMESPPYASRDRNDSE